MMVMLRRRIGSPYRLRQFLRLCIVVGIQQLAAPFEIPTTVAVGQKPIVPDARKSTGYDVHQEPPQEFAGVQRHSAGAVPMGVTIVDCGEKTRSCSIPAAF